MFEKACPLQTIRVYSAEQRTKAIETLVRFGCGAADTIAELGYPNRGTLRSWWKEYQIGGDEFLERRHRRLKYSDEEKQSTVDRCLEHGERLARMIRAMGYPSREVLGNWVDERTLAICTVCEKGCVCAAGRNRVAFGNRALVYAAHVISSSLPWRFGAAFDRGRLDCRRKRRSVQL